MYHLMLRVGWRDNHPPDPIPVRAYDADVTGAEVLMGLDVLRHGELILRGPEREFELLLPRRGSLPPG